MEENGVSLRWCDLDGTENIKYYQAVIRRSNWIGFLNNIGINGSKYVCRTDWKSGELVPEHLREMFPDGIVMGVRRKNRNLSQAAFKYFGRTERATEKADLVYSQSGRITEKMLDERPEIIDIIFSHNENFLNNIAILVYCYSKEAGLPTARLSDMVSHSFAIFRNRLTKKPRNEDFRWYLYRQIYHGLIDMNERRFSRAYMDNKERVDELRSMALI